MIVTLDNQPVAIIVGTWESGQVALNRQGVSAGQNNERNEIAAATSLLPCSAIHQPVSMQSPLIHGYRSSLPSSPTGTVLLLPTSSRYGQTVSPNACC